MHSGNYTRSIALVVTWLVLSPICLRPSQACTGITLMAKDGAALFGRTMEWGTFDLNSRVVIVPRGYEYVGHTPDGKPGISWTVKYGAVGLDALEKDIILDGMNEKGLTVNLFYFPGYTQYQKYDPSQAAESMAPTDVCQYLLTTCKSVRDAREAITRVRVVPVIEPALGFPAPVHLFVMEPSGQSVVIEFLNGKTTIFDAPLGVITNAPSYDWHETNLRNYINLSPVALPGKKIEELDFTPLGGGSGMIGLPGDFTPPSRFVRAVAFAKTARPTETGSETMYEMFRILDNFNVPLGASEGPDAFDTEGMRSSTIWTSAYDTRSRILYYHTQHNRRLRKVELTRIDFAKSDTLVRLPMDKSKQHDIEDVTPSTP